MITNLEDMQHAKDDCLSFQLVAIKALNAGKHAHPSHCERASFVLPFFIYLNSYMPVFSQKKLMKQKENKLRPVKPKQ